MTIDGSLHNSGPCVLVPDLQAAKTPVFSQLLTGLKPSPDRKMHGLRGIRSARLQAGIFDRPRMPT